MVAIISPQINLDYMQAAYDLQPMYNSEFMFLVGWIMVVICYLCLGRRTVLDRLLLRITQTEIMILTRRPMQVADDYG